MSQKKRKNQEKEKTSNRFLIFHHCIIVFLFLLWFSQQLSWCVQHTLRNVLLH